MSPQLKSLADQALQLSPDEREQLIDRLLASLDVAPLTDNDRAWVEEADRRFTEWQAGRAESIPGDQFTDEIRRDLGWPG